ncbi:MAG: histidine--tRNA ligase, partial [Clostridia bacterium]|nr:histidine--tRNA ligase [Clostridia bacterium]
HTIENVMRETCKSFGVLETRTPVFEARELFIRTVGEVTDVVQKEMYEFTDKGGRDVALKPEGTAGVVRMFIENGLFNNPLPLKQYYITNPIFRYEKAQAGRLREHHQFGIEFFGSKSALTDTEVILLALTVLNKLGVKDLALNINSIGCPNCRKRYNEALLSFLESIKGDLCETCNDRLNHNPLRILDCKNEKCQEKLKNAPEIIDYLCEECQTHFDELKENLQALDIKYSINPRIVRGLDYYTKTVFEIISNTDGFTVCGGGRYDTLIEQLGGPQTGAVGFGMGMERLILVMQAQGIEFVKDEPTSLYICSMGREADLYALKLSNFLKQSGITCEINHGQRSVKAQFKYADKLGAKYVLTVGESELNGNMAEIKCMEDGEVHPIVLNDFEGIKIFLTREM